MYIPYRVTLENVEAVMGALAINEADSVLAVCSSGDVAFAALERAKSVTAIDIEPLQIVYAHERAEFLRHKKYAKFLNPEGRRTNDACMERRNRYFHQKGRTPRIAANINNLALIEGDIFSIRWQPKFSKVYLSNAWGRPRDFARLLPAVAEGSLLYYSAYDELIQCYRIPRELVLQHKLTKLARQKEYGWIPVVYRKTTEKSQT